MHDAPGAARAAGISGRVFADGNVDRRVESAEVDIPARHLRPEAQSRISSPSSGKAPSSVASVTAGASVT